MKLTLILIIALVLSLITGAFFFKQYRTERAGRIRNENNVIVLAQENQKFKNDTNRAQTGTIKLTPAEFRKSFPDLVALIKNELNIKPNDVHQVTSTETVVNQTFKTHIKDSINYTIDTIPLKYMAYKDEWIDFEAQEIGEDLYVTRNLNRVPLLQVAHMQKPGKWKPKNILPWNWRKKELTQDVSTPNPHAKIEFSRTINISKN
ncbi:MAG: hypothetical protein PHX80_05410 [Candidatus Nanoarchaeia archaeon]|nr:hypothetical protein [Candidatus Nanoarchaeia archaeon]